MMWTLPLILVISVGAIEVVKRGLGEELDSTPTNMPTEHKAYVDEQYKKFMADRKKKKEAEQKAKEPKKPPPGISPKALGLQRSIESSISLTKQIAVTGGSYYFGSQMDIGGKVYPQKLLDGAAPRKLVQVSNFAIDEDCVTNAQFSDFIASTSYKTESELYGWSFVLESQASEDVVAEVDGEHGFGRVKDAKHWMAVAGASWQHPYGLDSDISELALHPVVHVSFKDASEYCHWAGGRRLPSEKEWEFSARGGRVNETYPWGNNLLPNRMNIWDGDFPTENSVLDGFHSTNPVKAFPPNNYGIYNMLGNVWEWTLGGTDQKRILRGGSFVDSVDGRFNHAVMVSTRQTNSGDSGASNIGFRCASGANPDKLPKINKKPKRNKSGKTVETDEIRIEL